MENKKIRLYIAHESRKNVVDKLVEASKKNKNVELLGSGDKDDRSLKEISLCHPDVAITGELSANECIDLFSLSPETQIVILTTDENRTSSTITELNKKGYLGISFMVLEKFSTPYDIIQNIVENYEPLNSEESFDPMGDFLGENGSEKQKNTTVQLEKELTEVQDETNQEKDELDKIQEKERLKEEEQKKAEEQKRKIELLELKNKFISVYSRKGGTGVTTIAKEIANLYSNIQLPKKLNYTNEYLKVCLVDLDFEQGNVRTHLGIENPVPNIYMWMEDILEKVKSGVKIQNIQYNKMQVLNRFVKKVDREFFVLCTNQGGIPYRIIDEIAKNDTTSDGSLMKKIIEIILNSLRRAFDIVVCDTPSTFDEACLVAMEKSDNILYVLNPTVSDVENFKVSVQELQSFDTINLDYVSLVMNKMVKNNGTEEYLNEMLEVVKYKSFSYELNKNVDKNFPVIRTIGYTNDTIQTENSFTFACDRGSHIKKDIINLCEFILPIFKIKGTNPKKTAIASPDKKKNNQKRKLTCKEFIEEQAKNPNIKKTSSGFPIIDKMPKELSDNKKVWKEYNKLLGKEMKEEKKRLKKAKSEKETKNAVKNEKKDTSKTKVEAKKPEVKDEKENNKNDFTNVKSLEEFLTILKKIDNLKHTQFKEFPVIDKCPKNLHPKVWKAYNKMLKNVLKEEHKEYVKQRKERKKSNS